tara:strand:+ start:2074 stop:2670 length:597 start_codon:yes stop_codon:yes gene_type:complete
MKVIGITGGMGSGKTKVLGFFLDNGITCYNSDEEAKRIMNTNPKVIEELKSTFGNQTYNKGSLNKVFLSKIVFNDLRKLKLLNKIIHPLVQDDFRNFKSLNKSKLIIIESALMFETGIYKDMDYIILITAPETIRINRIMKRDKLSSNNIKLRMNSQWEDNKKIILADFVIENISWDNTVLELKSLLNDVKSRYKIID